MKVNVTDTDTDDNFGNLSLPTEKEKEEEIQTYIGKGDFIEMSYSINGEFHRLVIGAQGWTRGGSLGF